VLWQNLYALTLQRRGDDADVAGLDEAAVGDEEHAVKVESPGQLAHSLHGASAEHDARARLKVEWDHLL
jgi:hypothetical protein